jgi:asparagine synthase (glutamine-hydrolysing)
VPDATRSVDDWCEALRAKTEEAVRLHLIADVPVGAFLSGGIDSSVIVALAARHCSGPLQTFSMGFTEESQSELPYAREVAKRYGTQHTEQLVTPEAISLLDELTWHFDEPFADTSAIPTFLVSRLARQSVKVVVSGDGGDEAFGGYARYAHDLKEARLRHWLPAWLRRWVLGPAGRIWPKADWLPRPLRFKTALTNLALDADRAYGNTLSICRPPLRRRLLAADMAASLNGHEPEQVICAAHALAPAEDALGGMIAADVATILPDDFLVKVDRASMAHGLEVRPPLLDYELLELAARIPSTWKIHQGETKWIFKRAFEAELPPTIRRRGKQGFEVPIDSWLRGPLREVFEADVLGSGSAVSHLIDQCTVRTLFDAHRKGTGRHGNVLWSVLVLAHWYGRMGMSRARSASKVGT